jgi:peptidoglycan hydrolase-like protein with peptidoglycan-binding domain
MAGVLGVHDAAATPYEQGAPASNGSAPTEQPISAIRPFEISGSVGRGGKNHPDDVQAVQTALNRRHQAKLEVDGKCGPTTIRAIEAFQRHLGQFKPDGLVEPRRGTARVLASSEELGPPPAPPQPIAPPKLEKPTLERAPAVWHGTRHILKTNIEELQRGVRAHYGSEHPDLVKAISENLAKLGVVLERLDGRLADSLQKAQAAGTEAERKAELRNAKAILTDYIKYVKSEPLIAHMDSNPFGVDTNLKQVLMDSLSHVAQVIR